MDLGFRSTFIRLISYAHAGAKDIETISKHTKRSILDVPNWELVGKLYSNMIYIYRILALIAFIVIGTAGTWAMIKPIFQTDDLLSSWLSWGVVAVASVYKFYGAIYSNYLEGLNKIPLVRRWESLTSIAGSVTSIIALLFTNDLLVLVSTNQFWVIASVARNFYLSRAIEGHQFSKLRITNKFDKEIFNRIWPVAWRSGISGIMSNGLVNITSILYAQIGTSGDVASYLLAVRIITQVKEISMAPFYSKIPLYSKLRIQGEIRELISKAQKGMFLSHLIYILGVIAVGLGSEFVISLLDSNIKFISNDLWILLSIAYFVHRFGAMHMQLYLTTNHVISHIADGVSGIIFVIISFALISTYGLYAIPIGMLAGYLGFYAWYATSASVKSLSINFYNFERKTSMIPLLLFAFYVFIAYII
ncbi:hypothetical protein LX87_00680 [Larkinella arboricola]|uniref:O-antigen/teichoic acid export membrane protein n=2 Tax=Larkinella arboricola TaxID=643671 RepID=A0A327X635_LARAB|nr:hypothetical protein LX87_00680 [Larkinella arboricola]